MGRLTLPAGRMALPAGRLALAVLLVACHDPTPAALPATRLLARYSLDARGVRPSVADLEAVQADPAAVDGYLDTYLADPRFGDQVRSAFAPEWLTRADEADIADADYAMADEGAFLSAMGEEPLRLLGYVAANDLPYTEVVTGDWTMVNEALAAWYPTDYPTGGAGWRKATWTDHRPAAGMLASNGLWWRYATTTGNANRGRANAIARVLLCSDNLARDIQVDTTLDLTDADAVQTALQTNPGCVACHSSMDPIGSYLWGFYVEFNTNPADLTQYHPEREHLWQTYGAGVAPGFYGTPGAGLADLGEKIAADARFPTCAVREATKALLQRDVGVDDAAALTTHREAFVQSGLTLRALWRSVMTSDEYRTNPDADPATTPWKMLSADQYVSALADITGWAFTNDGHDVYAEDRFGVRSLAGGGRAVFGAGSVLSPTPTMTLVHQRLGEAAAAYVAAADHADPDHAKLFDADDFAATQPSEDRIRALTLRVLSRDATDDEVATLTTLWTDLLASEGDAEAAWAGVLAVLFRHPDFLIY